jgi:hypothetical protein
MLLIFKINKKSKHQKILFLSLLNEEKSIIQNDNAILYKINFKIFF